ncbi:MAG TPA: glycosyl transferase [Alphaproteobacteria bacterium]|nr:glycosyl transferase [Alphaproteobacteria bacterium]
MTKVSALLCTYNTPEQYLREAIESVLNQTFPDFELIVLDDGSTNADIERIVKSYSDDRIRFYKNERNTGISAARNRMVDLARGEYLAVIDHDDVSLPRRFEKQVAYLDAHPDTGVVGGQAEFIPAGKVKKRPVDDESIKISLMRLCAIFHPACMIRKSVLEKTGVRYEERFSPAEDYALFCRLIPHTDFYNIPDVLLLYRKHKTNTSAVQSEKINRATVAIQNFARSQNPELAAIADTECGTVETFRLFNVLPVFSIRKKRNRKTLLLFGFLPVFSAKTKRGTLS